MIMGNANVVHDCAFPTWKSKMDNMAYVKVLGKTLIAE